LSKKFEGFSLKTVCIQGLGFVGAAMAAAVSLARDSEGVPLYQVIGVELNTNLGADRVEAINSGKFPFSTSDNDLTCAVSQGHKTGQLWATTDPVVYSTADIIIVDIALDISFQDEDPKFDLSDFESAIKAIAKEVSPGTLLLVETTVPPGTCEKIVAPILATELIKRGLSAESVYLAHSYERVMPGDNYLASITAFWRVYAGATEESARRCEEFLASFIDVDRFPLTRLSSMTASESSKLLENTYRAVNIALIDEWTKYAEAVNVDLYEIINAIKIRPTHSNIRYPGLGVGGYCLTKDPAFAPAATKQLFNLNNVEFPFAQLALKTNQAMPEHVVLQLTRLLDDQLSQKRVLVLGVSYREDVGDTRFSPVEIFVQKLINDGAMVVAYDPHLQYWPEMGCSLSAEIPDPAGFDAIVLCVRHKCFVEFDFPQWLGRANPVVLDTVNLLDAGKRQACRNIGITVASVGRGTSY
jgi:nucleotide sugar dehydrogenase